MSQFGFTTFQTTLLGCVDGVVESLYSIHIPCVFRTKSLIVLSIWLGVTLASINNTTRAYAAVLMYIPTITGTILVSALPSSNKVGLLFSYWLCGEKDVSSHGMLSHILITGYICSFRVCSIRHFPGMGDVYNIWTYQT